MRYVAGTLQILLMTTFLVSCSMNVNGPEVAPLLDGAIDAGPTMPGVKKSSMDVNIYPVNKMVCDPFGDNPDPRSNQGLKAELWWLEAGTPRQSTVTGMMNAGKKSDRSLFFSRLNVPTRMFNTGFANEMGSTVKDDTGATLIEYFALKFRSVLRLAPDQAETKYEFAILSDDGALLTLRGSDGVYKVNVNNDGDHPTRLGCGIEPISLTHESEIPMTIDYYQGPRHHISMIMLMREYNPNRAGNASGKDPACGVTGNDTWFDPNSGAPKQAYKDLLARGWKVLTVDNYGLPNTAMFNPCQDGAPPVISNFKVYERYNDGFIVTWNTDIPATSQVIATATGGAQTLTVSDNILRTSHEVRISGLTANTVYTIQGVSISETYGRIISDGVSALTDY